MRLSMAFVSVLCHHWIGSFFGLVILLKMACLIIDSILYSVENKSCLSSLLPLLLPRLRCPSSVVWVIHLLSDYYCWSLLVTIFPHDHQSHLEYKILLFFFLNTFTAHKSKHFQMAFLGSKYTPGPILKAQISLRFFGLQLQSYIQIIATSRQEPGPSGLQPFFYALKPQCPFHNSNAVYLS